MEEENTEKDSVEEQEDSIEEEIDDDEEVEEEKSREGLVNRDDELGNQEKADNEEETEVKKEEIKVQETQKQTTPEKKKLKKSTIGWIIFSIILVLVIASLIFLFVVGEQHKESTFTYRDFTFKKTPLGNDFVYETPLIFVKNGNPYEYVFKFRTDPRELGLIPANVSRVLTKNYFSFTPETTQCSGNALIAVFQIGQFLDSMGVEVEPSVTTNFSGNNITVANCSSALEFGVIELRPFANESRIYTDELNPNCVIIEAKNCSVVEATERYILAIIEAYKKPSQFKDLFENFSK